METKEATGFDTEQDAASYDEVAPTYNRYMNSSPHLSPAARSSWLH